MDIGEAINTATVVGLGLGYVGGYRLEQIAANTIARNRQALVGTHEAVGHRAGLLRRAVSSLAITAALAGGAFGESVTTTDSYQQPAAALALTIDHTAKTLDGTVDQINTVAESFSTVSPHVFHETAVVAHNSNAEVMPLQKIGKDRPFGQNIYLADAAIRGIEIASSNAPTVGSNALGSAHEKAGGEVILTDGDPIGDVVAADTDHLPIYIMNFDPKSDQVANYKAVAKETGGQYIPPQSNVKAFINKIKAAIRPNPVAERSTKDQWPWRLMGGALTLFTLGRFNRRRKETVGETIAS